MTDPSLFNYLDYIYKTQDPIEFSDEDDCDGEGVSNPLPSDDEDEIQNCKFGYGRCYTRDALLNYKTDHRPQYTYGKGYHPHKKRNPRFNFSKKSRTKTVNEK
jgi:hypothetical protein